MKKRIAAGIIMLISFAGAIFASRALCVHMRRKGELREAQDNLSRIVESEGLGGVTLTIHYASLTMDTPWAWDVEKLIKHSSKVSIEGDELKRHMDVLRELCDANLTPAWKKSYLNARIYYVFEAAGTGKIFDVAMNSGDSNIFANGIEIKGDDVFYAVLRTFLPEDLEAVFKEFKNRLRKRHI